MLSNPQPEVRLPVPVQAHPAVGWQFVLDLFDCGTAQLDDTAWVRMTMLEAARRADATVVGDWFHRFEPQGISGVVLISESHLAIHIWPEMRFAAVDVFTCSSALQTQAAVDYLVAAFEARTPATREFPRGEVFADADIAPLTIERCADQGAPVEGGGAPRAAIPVEDELYIDRDDETEGHWFVRRNTIVDRRSRYQKIEIVELSQFGRALVLDGEIQSVEADEYIYHEALVQPGMCLHECPRRVLIIGGGEGAVAREVLKHASVDTCVMVDIDGDVVSLAREHLPTWHQGAFDDPRLRVIIGDGLDHVRKSDEMFDVIVIDLVSSMDSGPAGALYSPDFYQSAKSRLSPGGVLVIQGVECHAESWLNHARIRKDLLGQFANIRSYAKFIPSYTCPWGFIIGSDVCDPRAQTAGSIDAVIAERGLNERLRFYDGQTHHGMFALSKDIRRLLGEV